MQFHCPIDGQALSAGNGSLKCPSGHSYDLAKEGYCNLLLVQQKASLSPGDNKEMVEARKRFLAAGYFAPIAGKLIETVKTVSPDPTGPRILDAGCGEGYYLGQVGEALPNAELAGIDISKFAVKAAAKSSKSISWAVASSKQLPFAKNSLDLILCLFGFPFWESFQSVLAKGGHLLLVDPAPEHLWELRQQIYDKVNTTDVSKIDGALALGFSVVSEETLTYSARIETREAIQDLLAMTPHGYRISPQAKERIGGLDRLDTKVSVAFRVLRAP